MTIRLRDLIVIVALLVSVAARLSVAAEPPIVLDPPVVLNISKDGAKPEFQYKAQAAKNGKIDLTATNGFFDRCFEAMDRHDPIPGDEGLITSSFGYLGRGSDTVAGTARWHLWCPEAGEIKATFYMQVPAGEADHVWMIKVGDETQTLKVASSDGQSPQPQTLTFNVKQPGKVTLTIDCTKSPPPAETQIHSIHLEGSAIAKASLLRTRWRPSAVHTHFYAPENCPAPHMWVFETVDVGKTGSYSPLTTPFGYFGTSFKPGGTIPIGAGFNFSMWIAGREATEAPPIEKMARLIGTDIPDAEYSTFGGEGTGVKFRAIAYKYEGDRTIQALRVEANGDVRTFYGYFYDQQEKRWKLYASAQAPAMRKNMSGLLPSTGSFCEIPGPPNRERSGDLIREIKRRGWFMGSDQKWYPAHLGGGDNSGVEEPADPADPAVPTPNDGTDVEKPKVAPPRAHRKAAPATPAAPVEQPDHYSDQRAYYLNDYATDGWIAMATGGMERHLRDDTGHNKPPTKPGPQPAIPEYLTPEKSAQLFALPVTFGPSKATDIAADHTAVDYEIKKTGSNSKAILYYGTVDSLTYPAQKVTKGSAVQIDMFRPERTWQSATPEQKVAAGVNQFKLTGLKGNTTYYYRLFVTHDQGKSWDYQSGSFKTP